MSTRKLAVALALNRVQFGLGLVLTPERNAAVWVGRKAAKREPAKVLAQALGARDLVLGIGAIAAASTAIAVAYTASPE
jgi:hypothetical protein